MFDRGESEVTGSAAGCAADCVADLVYYAAEGERLVGLVKTRRLMAMQKQQRAKVGMRMKALPKVTFEKGVRSPSRKPVAALTSALRSTT